MPLKINVPDSANAESFVSLGGFNYKLFFNFNSSDQRYRIDISLNDKPVITGLKVVEDTPLIRKYNLPDFDHGELYVLKLKDTDEPVGRNNFGIDKAYELIYVANSELI
jgi:hypothetical protein